MIELVTVEEYFRGYKSHPGITAEMIGAAQDLLQRVNALMSEAEKDGVEFQINQGTRTYISGEMNGGWRPTDAVVGAKNSAHKQAKAVDIYDPEREFSSWCMAHHDKLKHHGLCMERPEYTQSWTHLQSKPVASGVIAFVPSAVITPGPPAPLWKDI